MNDREARRLWRALYGTRPGLIGVHSALRPAPGTPRLARHRSAFFEYPGRAQAAAAWCLGASEAGLEAFFCAHLLTARRRAKANAAPVLALWADADRAAEGFLAGDGDPPPTAVVESSPGRAHLFWRLRRPVSPRKAEELNRRLLLAVGADRSGWDLSQLLRPPGTRNRKYEGGPPVRLLELDEGASYHPRELELALPPAAGPPQQPPARRPAALPSPTDLSRLTPRMRALIVGGNAALPDGYASRSEADFAACVAMFGAGYDEADVWAVMTDPAHGISEKYREKGRHGEPYLALTIGKARRVALPYPALRGRRAGGGTQERVAAPDHTPV